MNQTFSLYQSFQVRLKKQAEALKKTTVLLKAEGVEANMKLIVELVGDGWQMIPFYSAFVSGDTDIRRIYLFHPWIELQDVPQDGFWYSENTMSDNQEFFLNFLDSLKEWDSFVCIEATDEEEYNQYVACINSF